MKVNGYDIREYRFQNPPAVITYDFAFEQEQARIAAGLTKEQYWDLPGSPIWINLETQELSKCEVIQRYRLDRLINAVAEDAAVRKHKR